MRFDNTLVILDRFRSQDLCDIVWFIAQNAEVSMSGSAETGGAGGQCEFRDNPGDDGSRDEA